MSQPTTLTLDEPAPAVCRRERRASVRLQSSAKGCCQSLSIQREAGWEATVRDISCSGIGLLISRRFEIGTLLAIELAEAAEGPTRLLVARVVRLLPQSEGHWLVGCKLMSSLSEDEVRLLLGNTP
jgi:hypothetical protein